MVGKVPKLTTVSNQREMTTIIDISLLEFTFTKTCELGDILCHY